jgi:GMP synthase (glutamine-hydrolysing)
MSGTGRKPSGSRRLPPLRPPDVRIAPRGPLCYRSGCDPCAHRHIGGVTPERVEIVRKATKIVEKLLAGSGAFQHLAILHEDRVTGIRGGKRESGWQIEVRCFESQDAVTVMPTRLPFETLERLGERIAAEVPGVVSVTDNITRKPPTTIEAI